MSNASPVPAVVWHDLECGLYKADLPLWRRLAGEATLSGAEGAKVLDLGAGTGRVTLELARAGHDVTALERDPALLAALTERAQGLRVTPVLGDAREFLLAERRHDICVVPMQTLQLLHGPSERGALFACAREHLRTGARIACAIVGEVDEFDSRRGAVGPTPERRVLDDGTLFMSRAVRVAREGGALVAIERERLVMGPGPEPSEPAEHDRIELECVSVELLWGELRDAGFEPELSRSIAETAEHSGSEVVIAHV